MRAAREKPRLSTPTAESNFNLIEFDGDNLPFLLLLSFGVSKIVVMFFITCHQYYPHIFQPIWKIRVIPVFEYLIWIMLAQETEDRWERLEWGGLGGLSGGEGLVGADSFFRQDNCIYTHMLWKDRLSLILSPRLRGEGDLCNRQDNFIHKYNWNRIESFWSPCSRSLLN